MPIPDTCLSDSYVFFLVMRYNSDVWSSKDEDICGRFKNLSTILDLSAPSPSSIVILDHVLPVA